MNYLAILFTVLCINVFGQTKTVIINNNNFFFKTTNTKDDNAGGYIKQLDIYKNKIKVLSYTLLKTEGDCNSQSVELGNYEIVDSTIIFYTYWAMAGDAPVSPYGVRKQTYIITAKGKLHFNNREIYIETSRRGWKENKGIEYLFTKPTNAKHRKQLKKYVSIVEKEYKATFTFGLAKTALVKAVKFKLKKEIEQNTYHWKLSYADKIGGCKI